MAYDGPQIFYCVCLCFYETLGASAILIYSNRFVSLWHVLLLLAVSSGLVVKVSSQETTSPFTCCNKITVVGLTGFLLMSDL